MSPGEFSVRTNGLFSSLPGASLVARNVTPTVCRPAFTGMRGVDADVPGTARPNLLVPVEQLHALAVDRDLELLALDLSQQIVEVAGDPVDLDHVLAVGRELVLDEHAAARAERQPLDVAVLRRVGRRVVHRSASACSRCRWPDG